MSTITEIAPDVYRISTYVAEFDLQFNQFLVKDDEPLLYHTGTRSMFPLLWETAGKILEPSAIRWIGFSHFEADECGALNQWLDAAPSAEAVCTFVGAAVSVNDLAARPAHNLKSHEVLSTGKYRFDAIRSVAATPDRLPDASAEAGQRRASKDGVLGQLGVRELTLIMRA